MTASLAGCFVACALQAWHEQASTAALAAYIVRMHQPFVSVEGGISLPVTGPMWAGRLSAYDYHCD